VGGNFLFFYFYKPFWLGGLIRGGLAPYILSRTTSFSSRGEKGYIEVNGREVAEKLEDKVRVSRGIMITVGVGDDNCRNNNCE